MKDFFVAFPEEIGGNYVKMFEWKFVGKQFVRLLPPEEKWFIGKTSCGTQFLCFPSSSFTGKMLPKKKNPNLRFDFCSSWEHRVSCSSEKKVCLQVLSNSFSWNFSNFVQCPIKHIYDTDCLDWKISRHWTFSVTFGHSSHHIKVVCHSPTIIRVWIWVKTNDFEIICRNLPVVWYFNLNIPPLPS